MAITLEEFIGKLANTEKKIMDGLVAISEEAALNGKALAVRRIQTEGVGDYSDQPLPMFFFTQKGGAARLDKTKSNAGIRFIEDTYKDEEKRAEGITWADVRDAEGLQTNFVDLTFTGEMFRDLHIIGTNIQAGRVTTLLGASRAETIKKLEWNAERYGSFMAYTAEEEKMIRAIIQKRFTKLIQTVLT